MFADLLKQLSSTSQYFQIFCQYFDSVVRKKQQRLEIKTNFGLSFLHQLIIEIFSERFSFISIYYTSYVCIIKNVNGRWMVIEANLIDITSMNEKSSHWLIDIESKIKASQASNSLALIIYLRRSYNYFYFHFYMTIPRG